MRYRTPKKICGKMYQRGITLLWSFTCVSRTVPDCSYSKDSDHQYNLWVQITHMEMIKGITGHGYYDELVVPIIENTAREYELTDSLAAAVSPFFCPSSVLPFNLQRLNAFISMIVFRCQYLV